MTYRRRYRGRSGVAEVLELLVLDPTNPRSVAYQLHRMQTACGDREQLAAPPTAAAAVRLVEKVRLADLVAVAAVRRRHRDGRRRAARRDARRCCAELHASLARSPPRCASTTSNRRRPRVAAAAAGPGPRAARRRRRRVSRTHRAGDELRLRRERSRRPTGIRHDPARLDWQERAHARDHLDPRPSTSSGTPTTTATHDLVRGHRPAHRAGGHGRSWSTSSCRC